MSRTVWKYPLPFNDSEEVALPKGARPLRVGMQQGDLMLWALVDTDADMEPRYFGVRGTGHEVAPGAAYIGSTEDGPFVWHVFELFPPPPHP